jgi:flagellar biosynthesis GTPase FlhF
MNQSMNTRLTHSAIKKLGTLIMGADRNGKISFSPTVFLPHNPNDIERKHDQIVTGGGHTIEMTPNHLLPTCDGTLVTARSIKLGDCVRTVDGEDTVVSTTKDVTRNGVYTAVTKNEFLVVDGVVASPFALAHGIAHSLFDREDVNEWCKDNAHLLPAAKAEEIKVLKASRQRRLTEGGGGVEKDQKSSRSGEEGMVSVRAELEIRLSAEGRDACSSSSSSSSSSSGGGGGLNDKEAALNPASLMPTLLAATMPGIEHMHRVQVSLVIENEEVQEEESEEKMESKEKSSEEDKAQVEGDKKEEVDLEEREEKEGGTAEEKMESKEKSSEEDKAQVEGDKKEEVDLEEREEKEGGTAGQEEEEQPTAAANAKRDDQATKGMRPAAAAVALAAANAEVLQKLHEREEKMRAEKRLRRVEERRAERVLERRRLDHHSGASPVDPLVFFDGSGRHRRRLLGTAVVEETAAASAAAVVVVVFEVGVLLSESGFPTAGALIQDVKARLRAAAADGIIAKALLLGRGSAAADSERCQESHLGVAVRSVSTDATAEQSEAEDASTSADGCVALMKTLFENYKDEGVGWGTNGFGYRNFKTIRGGDQKKESSLAMRLSGFA